MNSLKHKKQIKTVSQITSDIKNHLENRFFNLSISGEISNFRPSAAGHCYFTLKDAKSNLSAVIFAGKKRTLTFEPKDGQQVIATGSISVYEPRGSYQIICTSLQLNGEGQILAMLEQRKRKLALEGFFDQKQKKEIPPFPKTIAVITSPTGAAIQDIINVISRRNNKINLKIFPAIVQGEKSASQLVDRIKQANRWKNIDVIILTRGGGSIEDLLSFSDEQVVRAISQSEIPIISAVGHEIDRSLSDFAADLYAPTPSAAAELVTQESTALLSQVKAIRTNCFHAISQQTGMLKNRMLQFSPEEMKRTLSTRLNHIKIQADLIQENLIHSIEKKENQLKHKLELLTNSLNENSPSNLKKRGFSKIFTADGKIITSISQLKVKDQIKIAMTDGQAKATVEEKLND